MDPRLTPMEPDLPDPAGVLGAVLDSLDTWTVVLDAAGRIAYANSAWRAYQGPDPFVAGLGPGDDYLARIRELIASPDGNLAIVALGLQSMAKGRIPKLRLEFPVKVGETTAWFGVMAAAAGTMMILHHHDLTERTRSLQRLHRVESLFKATTENAMDLISIMDLQGRFVFSSHSHTKVLGYSQLEWAQVSLDTLIHPDDRAAFADHLTAGRASGLGALFEFRMRHVDGSWRCFEGRAAAVDSAPGGPENVLLISRDITRRKEAETERALMEIQLRQAQKMEAVGQLAAGIAHEINTPTQYITDNVRFLEEAFGSLCQILKDEIGLLAEAAKDPALAGRAQDILDKIRQEDLEYLLEEVPRAIDQSVEGLGRVASIVKAMKVFSHPGTEGQVTLDLNQAVENTCLVARNEWKYVADLKTVLDPDQPSLVCYPGEINQMILNLVINAAHAIGAREDLGGAKGGITVETRRCQDHVEIRVTDTGTGIPEAIRDRIFLPFFTTKPVGKGTGQGLSLVHSVVARHGGEVTFTTEMGLGTTFFVRLPMNR